MSKFKIDKKTLWQYRLSSFIVAFYDKGTLLLFFFISFNLIIYLIASNDNTYINYYQMVEHKFTVGNDEEKEYHLLLVDPTDNEVDTRTVEKEVYDCTEVGGTYDMTTFKWYLGVLGMVGLFVWVIFLGYGLWALTE